MTLAPGTQLGPYEILAPLGAGGMGEVYRARDTRLGREVAIKVLPDGFELDPERVSRFEREAKLLASMNHPNIAVLYGVEHHERALCLALELIEGESLAERLKRGALPADEALDVAAQVAGALEAAHDAGIVHRDLKPGNVMLRPDGVAKVLDFGLARGQAGGDGPASQLTQSPTMTSPATMPGVILGTAAYMSPEQAKGRRVDRRADLWAWGCLLYELLAGVRAFPGEDVSETMAAILKSEPDWGALPTGLPVRVRELLERCLRKDPRERLRDAGDARLLLAEARVRQEPQAPAAEARSSRAWRWAVPLVLAALAVAAAGALRSRAPEGLPLALMLVAPDGVRITGDPNDMAISPDGSSLVFVARDTNGVEGLWLRPLGRAAASSLPGTREAVQPFWSPDGRRIGFFADGKLKTMVLATGAIETLCDAPQPRGGAWGRDAIVLQPRSLGPLMRIPERGGTPVATTVVDSAARDAGHRFPCMLPDGSHFVYSILTAQRDSSQNVFRLAVGSLSGDRSTDLTPAGSGAVYAAPGYLLFVKDGAVRAQRLDVRTRRLTGPALAVPGLDVVYSDVAGAPILTASANGVVVERSAEDETRTLEWMDRAGRTLGMVPAPKGRYANGQLSPDGRRLAIEFVTSSSDPTHIWVLDLARGTSQRMTFDGENYSPVWSPEGREIAITRNSRGSVGSPWVLSADSPGTMHPLASIPRAFNTLLQYAPDGNSIVYRVQGLDTQQDLFLLTPGDSTHLRPLLRTRFNELQGSVSPDGRWMAYLSDESGRLEVYVRRFPGMTEQQRVSTDGAYASPTSQNLLGRPAWRRDMRELQFVAADGRTVMSVTVTPGDPLAFGTARPLFRLPASVVELYPTRDLDRFLVEQTPASAQRSSATALVNWRGFVEGTR